MLSFRLIPAFSQNANPIAHQTTQELRVFDPSLIDKTVNPCENFYRYSCNGWFKRNPLPPDQTSYGRFTELYELNRLHLKQILEDASKPDPNAHAQRAEDRRRVRELHGHGYM